MDEQRFVAYYGGAGRCAHISVPGRTFPVKPIFLDNILQVPSATHTATVTQNPATSLHKGEISEQATNSSLL